MVEDILELPPELGYQIYKYCDKSDLINFACCSQLHYESVKYLLFKNIRIPWKIVETKTFQAEELENFKFACTLYFSDYDLSSIFSKVVWDSISHNYQEILLHTNPEILTSLKLESIIINEDNSMTIHLPCNLREISLTKCCGISLTDWEYIGRLNCLRELTINQCNINDSSMENLVSKSTIQSLNLIRCSDITEKSLSYLRTLSTLKKIKIMDCESISPDGYAYLGDIARVNELILSDVQISEYSLSSFIKLKCLKNLQIQCSPGNPRNANNIGLSYLAGPSMLETLCINSDLVNDDEFCELINLQRLKHLNISCCTKLGDAGFFEICKLTALTELNISNTEELTDNGIKHIKDLQSLTCLDISNCVLLTDLSMYHIKELTLLERINLSQCTEISDQGLDYISSLKFLRYLDISGCYDVTDVGMFCICNYNQSIEVLIMTGCTNVTDDGLSYVQDLKLKELDVSLDLYKMQGHCMKTNNVGLRYVSSIMTLRHLNISCCHFVTDEGLLHVGNLKLLSCLNISRCPKISDAGLSHLCGLRTLRDIDVSMCAEVTDIGISYLCNLLSVKYIDLHGCPQVSNVWPSKYPFKVFRYRCLKPR